jgi:hypothetical protein
MNAIQKTTFAASALAITLAGAVLVTAPLAFARPVPVVAHRDCASASLQVSRELCRGAVGETGLVALNRR